MLLKKSVVLTSIDNSLKKAVINFDGTKGIISGTIKLYNFMQEPTSELVVGILIDEKFQKTNLVQKSKFFYEFYTDLTSIPENCSVALIGDKEGSMEPILIGAITQNTYTVQERLIASLCALTETKVSKVQEILDNNQIDFENNIEVEKEIDEEIKKQEAEDLVDSCAGGCENCLYKDVFYSENSNSEIAQEKNEDLEKQLNDEKQTKMRKPPINKNNLFFEEISGQLGILFDNYPTDEILSEIIPNSKWVKVDYENNGNYYVVGLIYEDEKVLYVCYGIPARWSQNPPSDFNENAKWLPIKMDDPEGDGYWLMYQDAKDGEMVNVEII